MELRSESRDTAFPASSEIRPAAGRFKEVSLSPCQRLWLPACGTEKAKDFIPRGGRERDRDAERQTDRQRERRRDRETERQRDRETDKQGDRQAERERSVYLSVCLSC